MYVDVGHFGKAKIQLCSFFCINPTKIKRTKVSISHEKEPRLILIYIF